DHPQQAVRTVDGEEETAPLVGRGRALPMTAAELPLRAEATDRDDRRGVGVHEVELSGAARRRDHAPQPGGELEVVETDTDGTAQYTKPPGTAVWAIWTAWRSVSPPAAWTIVRSRAERVRCSASGTLNSAREGANRAAVGSPASSKNVLRSASTATPWPRG